MSKKKEETEVAVNQPANAPIAPTTGGGNVSRETLSHQWQENSPAINTNVLAGYAASSDSIMDKIDSKEKTEAAEDAAELREKQEIANQEKARVTMVTGSGTHVSDYDYRTTLDVSNPLYINPSLDHLKSKKGK